MTVHPDWFNNVYDHDWDITAKKVLDKMPGVDAMYAFQLTGYAASSTEYIFPDWNWYQEHGSYPSQTFDLAGGGQVIESGIWNQKNSLNISVPHAGKYILRIGKQNHSITVK